ncbi:unnamed protein product [Lathyrus oleraceus]
MRVERNLRKYGFIDPTHISLHGGMVANNITTYVQEKLLNKNKECYLTSFFRRTHWQLIVICLKRNIVVIFCLLHKELEVMINVLSV